MGTRLSAPALRSRDNAFTFLRLWLALQVVFSHTFLLGGYGPDPLQALKGSGFYDLGGMAVFGFFSISGFLVTRSFFETSSAARYFWKRALRIFPAFWCSLLVLALVIGPLLYLDERGSLAGYFSLTGHEGPAMYLVRNGLLWFGQAGISGLLSSVPHPLIFNDAIWTLFPEFLCYAGVFILGHGLRSGGSKAIFPVAFLVFWIPLFADPVPGRLLFSYTLYRLPASLVPAYFLAGASAYCYRDRIPLRTDLFLLALAAVAVCALSAPWRALGPLGLTYALLWLAAKLPLRLDRYGDCSYGVYLYSCPIQQVLAYGHFNRYPWLVFFALSALLSLLIGMLSWHLIEKRALNLKVLPGFRGPLSALWASPTGEQRSAR